ncbi:MAG: DUF2252 domain-containing protein [Micropruina sp.]
MTWSPLPSQQELIQTGCELRKRIPRRSLATLGDRPRDPLGILDAQNSTRVQSLIPLRTERMSASAFAFYRGTAALMAADLADDPHTGLLVAACGDAHVSNFGFYASRTRNLMFDLNDFDESAWAPWEWDLKRLVASVVIGARHSGRSDEVTDRAAVGAVMAYRHVLNEAMALSPTQRFFSHFDAQAGMDRLKGDSKRVLDAAIRSAQKRTGERAVRRLTTKAADGRMRFIERPPTMTRMDPEAERDVHVYVERWHETAAQDVRLLVQHYDVADVARRVVGVGSVGTRCSLVLLQDRDDHALILQSKEANVSVLEQYGRIAQPERLTATIASGGEGARVVAMQRILQAVSDPFLGYLRGAQADLYVRQFNDMKGGIEVDQIEDRPFIQYAQACAATLARAHSQSPRAAAIVGYLGSGKAAAEAIADWSHAYADLSAKDFQAFIAANRPADQF